MNLQSYESGHYMQSSVHWLYTTNYKEPSNAFEIWKRSIQPSYDNKLQKNS